MHDKYTSENGAFCGTGNSGGAGELLQSMTHYGRDEIFDMILPSGGPAVTRLDFACALPTDQEWISSTCPGIISAQNWQSPDINGNLSVPLSWEVTPSCTLDNSNGVCSAVSEAPTVAELRNDSVLSLDAKLNFPKTFVYSLNGTEDDQISPVVGLLFNSQVQSEKLNVVVDSPHVMSNDPEGALQIERAMKGYCTKRH